MVRETYEDGKIPAGEHKFWIAEIGERVSTTNSHYRQWKFKAIVDGETKELNQNLFPFMAMPLLEAIGFKNIKGKIDWDTEEALGKHVIATVIVEKDKKDATKEYPRLMGWKATEQDENIEFGG